MNRSGIAYETTTEIPFDVAVQRCRDILTTEGFRVLTEIDIRAALKRLGVEREPFVILGAYHPPWGQRALAAQPEVGVVLPCNVTVSVEDGKTVVRAMNPHTALSLLHDPEIEAVAADLGGALKRLLAALA